MERIKGEIADRLQKLAGQSGIYFKDLVKGEDFAVNADVLFTAASIIKIPVMVEVFKQVDTGLLSFDRLFSLREEDKLPPCGVLTYLHQGLSLSLRDLCILMIIISDNTATNMLIKLVGRDRINATMEALGLPKTRVNRLLFDHLEEARGVQNYFTLREMGQLLEAMWQGALISPPLSREMLNILKLQTMNHKIPALLPPNTVIAHKTGEDEGITYDVALVYAARPFLLGLAAENTDVHAAEEAFRDIARMIFQKMDWD